MKMDETEYTELYMELEKYEKRGIDMLLDGYQASPLQIVTAHMVKEAGTYMRDYTMSGDLRDKAAEQGEEGGMPLYGGFCFLC